MLSRWKTAALRCRQIGVIAALVIVVIASIVALVRWDMGRECVRWATRIDALDGVSYSNYVCVEFAPRDRRKDAERGGQR